MRGIKFEGLKAWLFFIAILIGIILFFAFLLGLVTILLPIIVLLIIFSFLLSLFKRKKKLKKDYVDVKYKVKK